MFHVFGSYGYEEHEFRSFKTKKEAQDYILAETEKNEHSSDGWYCVAVIEGKELPVEIVKRSTSVKIG